jgi:hypothetical protein
MFVYDFSKDVHKWHLCTYISLSIKIPFGTGSICWRLTTGSNPTTVSYNAGAVKIYNATSSPARFESKTIFVLKSAVSHSNAGVLVVKYKFVRLAPWMNKSWKLYKWPIVKMPHKFVPTYIEALHSRSTSIFFSKFFGFKCGFSQIAAVTNTEKGTICSK